MNYKIRNMEFSDLEKLEVFYADARQRMRDAGNPNQWWDFHPPKELLIQDIETKNGYIIEDLDTGEIAGAFAMIGGVDPTYINIEGGEWLNDDDYVAIHHIASSGHHHKILETAVNFALNKIDNVRIDTYKDNKIMQSALEKLGFKYCGTIYVLDHQPRMAYHLTANR